MRRVLLILALVYALVLPVHAIDLTAPEAPDAAQELMEDKPDGF